MKKILRKDITEREVWSRVPVRVQDSHKGTYGKLFCVAGSRRYRGAAALTVEGGLRGGCGIVTLASVEPVFASVQARLPEAILFQCEEAGDGGISASNADKLVDELKNDYAALVMGPGMGNTNDTRKLVQKLTTAPGEKRTVILDADALNALSGCSLANITGSGKCRFIITPHPGEMARLCGCTITEIKNDRERIILEFAKKNNSVVVLKEHRTLIASPDGELWQNTSGNSGLARGGSGDILAGLMGSLAAQGMNPLDAAICAVWLHGAAAQRCSARKSQTVMLPHDIFEDLGLMFIEQGR